MGLHQIGKDINRILAPDASGHVDSQAFPGVLVDHDQDLQWTPVRRAIEDEVDRPNMICVFGFTANDAASFLHNLNTRYSLLYTVLSFVLNEAVACSLKDGVHLCPESLLYLRNIF